MHSEQDTLPVVGRNQLAGAFHRFLGLCLPPILYCLIDDGLTLIGQPAEYWAGDYSRVNEGSPTFHYLLSIHPMAFVAGAFLWICLFVAILLLLPETLALIMSIAIVFGHTAGAATWLLWRPNGYQLCNALFLLSAAVSGVGIRWGWRAVPQKECGPARLPARRWLLIAVLFGIGVYLYLWPRSA